MFNGAVESKLRRTLATTAPANVYKIFADNVQPLVIFILTSFYYIPLNQCNGITSRIFQQPTSHLIDFKIIKINYN